MKYPILFFSLLLGLSACDSVKSKQEKELRPNEIAHLDELSFRVDTLKDDQGQSRLSYGSEVIPNYYVLRSVQTDSTIDMHIFPDQRLYFIQANDTFYITKDSLLKDINNTYLNEAILQGLEPISLDGELEEYQFQFFVRKPFEEDRFNYELYYRNKTWQLIIVD